jgi:hypothetical protein
MKESVKEYMRQIGSRGGKRAAQRMTAAQRRARARKASRARYAKKGASQ